MSDPRFSLYIPIICSAEVKSCPRTPGGKRVKHPKRCYGCNNATMNGQPFKEGIKI